MKRNIALKYNYEKGVCLLEPDLVRSLIINLMDNSRKAMTDNGHGIISVEVKMTDSGCSIIVKDNGKGMPPEALQHITEAFTELINHVQENRVEPIRIGAVCKNCRSS